MNARLYGIRNCDSVKKARKWLESRKINYDFHDFREDGLGRELLANWVESLGWEALLNRRSTSWRQLSETDRADLDTTKAQLLMHSHPTLIKRPVLDAGGKITVGFRDADYEAIFCQ